MIHEENNEQSASLGKIYGNDSAPYYIFAPRWTEESAGIRALHYLCHSLNNAGQKAYIAFDEPPGRALERLNPRLHTPPLTKELVRLHKSHGISPIVIYSESVVGNPLRASWAVRYLLNYPGFLGGPANYPEGDLLCAFSKDIMRSVEDSHYPSRTFTLFLPPVDPRDIVRSSTKEDFQVIYAGKYRDFVGEPPSIGGNIETIEIFRSGPKKQSRPEVMSLISRARTVYSFENSSIVTEAVLSGTPAVFVPNQFLNHVIGEDELGKFGTGMLGDEQSIKYAQQTLVEAQTRYFELISEYSRGLQEFINLTQVHNLKTSPKNDIAIRFSFTNNLVHKLELALGVYRKKGLLELVRATAKFFRRQLGKTPS